MLNKENTLDKSHLSAPCWRNTQKKRALEIPSSLRMTATLARTLSGPHEKNVEMIEAGQVANLIVKDASHLGREYLQVGYYMEILFTHAFVMGLCYYLITRCSICTYMKKIGASELMPLFCELDEVTITLQHGLLHQKQTLANGSEYCDYFITGNKE